MTTVKKNVILSNIYKRYYFLWVNIFAVNNYFINTNLRLMRLFKIDLREIIIGPYTFKNKNSIRSLYGNECEEYIYNYINYKSQVTSVVTYDTIYFNRRNLKLPKIILIFFLMVKRIDITEKINFQIYYFI